MTKIEELQTPTIASVVEVVAPKEQRVEDGDDDWIKNVDLHAFKRDVELLGKTLQDGQGEADLAHLHRIVLYNRMLSFVGVITLGLYPNPLTVLCLSLAVFSRWTMIGHHVCHGGYDKVDKSGKYNRYAFAVGSLFTRCTDWLDWMLPEAWNLEHNKLHHYSLNEDADPDLVEANLELLRDANVPLFVKYVVAVLMMFVWKWFYYAPNTFGQLKDDLKLRQGGKLAHHPEERMFYTLLYVIREGAWGFGKDLISVMLPYFVVQFLLKPLPLLVLFYQDETHAAYKNAVINLVLAELVTNAHSFLMIVTNHAGDDLYRFTTKCEPRSEHFYLRQIVGSADFACGTEVVDFMHGYLNYQIEHHLFPSLSMLSYQKAQPLVKSLCAKHQIPYVQESVFIRLKKTMDIMVGKTSMRPFPEQ
ncbi:hypothetical protein BASA81_006143 [Batrachochytrium salamandrivorans]|nr:hypothetical protein BASA81_006143 [Batrachochytrium salamandrivorans]